MIKISNGSINGLKLNTKRENIDENNSDSSIFSLEFNEKQELITLSTRLVKEFSINNNIINFNNIHSFLIENDALYDGEFIIIPTFSLSLYINFEDEIFLEILIYSSSVKDVYEKSSLTKYEDYVESRGNIKLSLENLIYIPYTSLGEYKFGVLENQFLNQTKLLYHQKTGVNGKKYYEHENVIFRFDQDSLSQIYVNNPSISITFEGLNINSVKGLNILLTKYPVLKSRSHTILLDLGIAVNNKIKEGISIYFFSNYLIKYWQNTHRPITSW